MEKILGKIAILICLMASAYVQAYITLEVNSFDGRRITEVSAGEAFILKISTDEVDQVHDVQIQGLQGIPTRKTGLSLITVNGKKTAQISFQVEVSKPGIYTFGPAAAPNGQSQSDIVRIKVNAESITDRAATKKEKDASRGSVLLQLAVDQDTVFVGQKIKATLRAYFPEGEDISIDQVISNDPVNIETTDKIGPKKGAEKISGKNYIVLEWQWEMYPKEPGQLVIPAYFLDYAKALPTQQGFGGLAMFFGPRYERKRAYSNALSIQVRSLPEPVQPINGIGNFLYYRAQIKPSIAKKYEGAVLSLTIEGEGNVEKIEEPELRGLPDALKYYFSKSYITPSNFGERKTFEYIVQGMQEGEWEIPAQIFKFFDVESRTYKTLESSSLLVTIIPGQPVVGAPEDTNRKQVSSVQEPVGHELLQSMMPHGLPSQGALPMSLFAFLFCLPLGIFALDRMLKYFGLVQIISRYYTKHRAFALAQKDLAKAYRKHDIRAIHGIFVQLINRRTGCEDGVLDKAVQEGFRSDEQKKSWQIFYEEIAQAAYADNSNAKDVVRLFHESAQRLKDLEGII